jgi:hypothetical protein
VRVDIKVNIDEMMGRKNVDKEREKVILQQEGFSIMFKWEKRPPSL